MPREVLALNRDKRGKRSLIYSEKELELFAKMYSGTQDPFISIFRFSGEKGNAIIDKIPYDFDAEHDPYALKFARWLYENKIPFIPIGTHFNRYHIYVLIYPQEMTSAELRKAQLSLLEQAECYKKVENGNGSYYQAMCDMHIVGDIRRLIRIPNTARYPENIGEPVTVYCTYLPLNFYELPKSEIYSFLKHHNEIPDSIFPIKRIDELIKPVSMNFRNSVVCEKDSPIFSDEEYISDDPYLQFIQKILRPCVFRAIVGPNPRNHVRVAATIDLRDLDFTESQILDIYNRIGWADWKEEKSEYYIDKVFAQNHYLRYSCSKLRIDVRLVCEANCIHMRKNGKFIPLRNIIHELK